MLSLGYSPEIPRSMIEILEFHGRRLGASLDALERVGQSLSLVESFIVACESGHGLEFLNRAGENAEDLLRAPPLVLSIWTPRGRHRAG